MRRPLAAKCLIPIGPYASAEKGSEIMGSPRLKIEEVTSDLVIFAAENRKIP